MSIPDDLLGRRVRTMQICVGSLLGTLFVFLIISLVVVANNGPILAGQAGQACQSDEDLPLGSITALVLLVINAPFSLLFPRIVMRRRVQGLAAQGSLHSADDGAGLLEARQVILMLGTAPLEATGLA